MAQASHEVVATGKALAEKCSIALNPEELMEVDVLMRYLYGDEIEDASTVKSIFCTNKGYRGLKAPMLAVEGKDNCWIPNFGYRYLSEDIPRGLCLVKAFARLLKLETPTLDLLIRWGQQHLGKCYLDDQGDLQGADAAAELQLFLHHIEQEVKQTLKTEQ